MYNKFEGALAKRAEEATLWYKMIYIHNNWIEIAFIVGALKDKSNHCGFIEFGISKVFQEISETGLI